MGEEEEEEEEKAGLLNKQITRHRLRVKSTQCAQSSLIYRWPSRSPLRGPARRRRRRRRRRRLRLRHLRHLWHLRHLRLHRFVFFLAGLTYSCR